MRNHVERMNPGSWHITTPMMRAPRTTARQVLAEAGHRGMRLIEYSADLGYRPPQTPHATLMWFGSRETDGRYTASWALDVHAHA